MGGESCDGLHSMPNLDWSAAVMACSRLLSIDALFGVGGIRLGMKWPCSDEETIAMTSSIHYGQHREEEGTYAYEECSDQRRAPHLQRWCSWACEPQHEQRLRYPKGWRDRPGVRDFEVRGMEKARQSVRR